MPLSIQAIADQLSGALRHIQLSHEYAVCGQGQYLKHPADHSTVIQQHYTNGINRGQAQAPEFFQGIAL